jgi:hypothetical protein
MFIILLIIVLLVLLVLLANDTDGDASVIVAKDGVVITWLLIIGVFIVVVLGARLSSGLFSEEGIRNELVSKNGREGGPWGLDVKLFKNTHWASI